MNHARIRNLIVSLHRFTHRPYTTAETNIWRDARVVEEARLESVYTPKGYRGFESPSLRRKQRNELIAQLVTLFFRPCLTMCNTRTSITCPLHSSHDSHPNSSQGTN